jgi:predicted RNA-binding protein
VSLIDNLPHTGTHTRPNYQQDELGATVAVQETVATGMACWVQNASMAEIEAFQKLDTEITHKVFFAANPGLLPGDEFVITAGPSFVGITLTFQAGPTDRSAGLGVLFAAMFTESN